jgi:hypothetical protein
LKGYSPLDTAFFSACLPHERPHRRLLLRARRQADHQLPSLLGEALRYGPVPAHEPRGDGCKLGWDSCDVILVTGDAYVDHPSFGMAVIGRVLEAQGFRVGIIAQPDWQSAEAFKALGKPNLFWGVTAGNMDSMINRYTADRKIRSDDAYTPGDVGGKPPRPRGHGLQPALPRGLQRRALILGGIEGVLRRIAHYDYWSDKVRRSMVVDAKCDLLLYGNAERALIEIAHRLAAKRAGGAASPTCAAPPSCAARAKAATEGWFELDSTQVDSTGPRGDAHQPLPDDSEQAASQGASCLARRALRFL